MGAALDKLGAEETTERNRVSVEAAVEARAWAEQARVDMRTIQAERELLQALIGERRAYDEQEQRDIAHAKQALIDELATCDQNVLRRLSRRDVAELLEVLEEDD